MGRIPICVFYCGCCGHIFEVSFFTPPSHTLVLMACQVSKFISFTFFSLFIFSQSLILFILAPLVFFLFILYFFFPALLYYQLWFSKRELFSAILGCKVMSTVWLFVHFLFKSQGTHCSWVVRVSREDPIKHLTELLRY